MNHEDSRPNPAGDSEEARGAARTLASMVWLVVRRLLRGRNEPGPFDKNPLPLFGAFLAAVSGLFPRRRSERAPARSRGRATSS